MKILVPVDFTAITESGYKYALSLPFASEIILLHCTDSKNQAQEASKQLDTLIKKYPLPQGIKINILIVAGSIFDHLGQAAEEVNAGLIVMATHGIKGMQHYLGSHAMKLITHSKTPFIVVQQRPYKSLQKMLVPVDYTKEVKQELPVVIQYAKLFKATVLLLKQNHDDTFIQNRSNRNTDYFIAELTNAEIEWHLIEQKFSVDNKYEVINHQAAANDADIIVTTIEPDLNIADYVMGVEEQKIVANSLQLPVLCVNIRQFTSSNDIYGIYA